MNCYLASLVGVGLLGASLYTMTVTKAEMNKLSSLLSPEVAAIYQKIAKERMMHYLIGLLLGALIAYFVVTYFTKSIRNMYYRMMIYVSIVFITTVLFYLLMPKSDYMLNHLTTEKQIQAWLSIYKTMKSRYLIGFILGCIASIPLSYLFC
jgi:uncharacterized protein YacL